MISPYQKLRKSRYAAYGKIHIDRDELYLTEYAKGLMKPRNAAKKLKNVVNLRKRPLTEVNAKNGGAVDQDALFCEQNENGDLERAAVQKVELRRGR